MDPGTRLGLYEIKEPLGKGGMGEVYRAHDSNLRRDVAIKVLPRELAADERRLGRLKREARSLASPNHSNIAAVYGFEEHEGTSFIVMELVEGETLAEKLEVGPLPVEEALELAVQIAKALEAAHGRGIVHRDLKPSNVKITPAGEAKVLDFGLAKPLRDGKEEAESGLPTATVEATRTGTVMGTPPYMSPEQVRGEEVDERTDVWAFGCLLYEMLTGRRPFSGNDPQETLAAILRDEPDWEVLPEDLPWTVRRLLQRCLRKDPTQRIHHVADARIELENPEPGRARDLATSGATGTWQRRMPWMMAAVTALLAAGMAFYWSDGHQTASPVHAIALPPDAELALSLDGNHQATFAISPDGSRLAYLSGDVDGDNELYVKRIDEFRGQRVDGSEGAQPGFFFSPDGRWIAFTTEGRLWRIPVDGGSPLPICDLPGRLVGATWRPDDTIVLSSRSYGGLSRVAAGGGEPEPLTEPDADRGEVSHRWPQFLPGGQAVVFNVWQGASWDEAEIAILSLESGERKTLSVRGAYPRFVSSGHLLYGRADSLFAVPFDTSRLQVTGTPKPVLNGISVDSTGMGIAHYAVADDGTLVFVPESQVQYDVVLIDRTGQAQPLAIPAGFYNYFGPRFSPDGRYLAIDDVSEVYIHDLERGSFQSITTEDSSEVSPLWTPDGRRVIFSSDRGGFYNLFSIPMDASGPAERILESTNYQYPTSVAPDGSVVLYEEQFPETAKDILAVPLDGDGSPTVLVRSNAHDAGAVFSPDGRFFAYVSARSGQYEVYVRPYPDHSSWRQQISTDGGRGPIWSSDGRELFYLQDNRLMAVPVGREPDFSAGAPRLLFEGEFAAGSGNYAAGYDLAPDGEHFAFREVSREPTPTLHLVLNWLEELERQVPTSD